MGMEAEPLNEDAKVTVTDSFYGTIFSSSGVRWVAPDHIDRYISCLLYTSGTSCGRQSGTS